MREETQNFVYTHRACMTAVVAVVGYAFHTVAALMARSSLLFLSDRSWLL